MLRAHEDPALRPVVTSRRALRYADGGDPTHDRTAHVRAASGLTWMTLDGAPRLVVAQDDTSFLAVIDPEPIEPRVRAIALDHVVGGRRVFEQRLGNKKQKLDLEACTTLAIEGREHALVVGSGSLPIRERLVLLDPEGRVRVLPAPQLYASLRANVSFAGSELNLEGAVAIDGRLVLFQRGNGAASETRTPTDATCSVELAALLGHLLHGAPLPPLERITPFELGSIEGVRLTFTDATRSRDGLAFLAGAEASPNAIDDGVVFGVALGTMGIDGRDVRWGRVRELDGSPFLGKAEGLAPQRSDVGDGRFWAVTDRDDPDSPSELLAIELR
ncbi:MAG: hypothetical protein J0L92_06450 [Deltaproteobacteria bacterium]|nr:hypothetical protein [Deltaproteobacteria bacterium]